MYFENGMYIANGVQDPVLWDVVGSRVNMWYFVGLFL